MDGWQPGRHAFRFNLAYPVGLLVEEVRDNEAKAALALRFERPFDREQCPWMAQVGVQNVHSTPVPRLRP